MKNHKACKDCADRHDILSKPLYFLTCSEKDAVYLAIFMFIKIGWMLAFFQCRCSLITNNSVLTKVKNQSPYQSISFYSIGVHMTVEMIVKNMWNIKPGIAYFQKAWRLTNLVATRDLFYFLQYFFKIMAQTLM